MELERREKLKVRVWWPDWLGQVQLFTNSLLHFISSAEKTTVQTDQEIMM